ncbi:MAG TPA: TIGR02281 family clan AA aspartic protease [Sphingomonadaceae bacterium]|jgi:aspartyl protease family protein|nr:TIGR02281 family clan AA aspartic protease [Sphingomonadaceae bacterium]
MFGLPSTLPAAGLAFLAALGLPAGLGQSDALPRPDSVSARAAIVEVPESVDRSASEFTRAADGLFYIQATVNGEPVRFLVDTGASVVVLTPEDARRVGARLDEDRYSAHVETVGGKAAMAWTTLDHVTVAGRKVHQLRAAVVRDGLGVSLLGQNMLSKLASVTIEGDRLRLR